MERLAFLALSLFIFGLVGYWVRQGEGPFGGGIPRRVVKRDQEPGTFWFSIVFQGSLGLLSLAKALALL